MANIVAQTRVCFARERRQHLSAAVENAKRRRAQLFKSKVKEKTPEHKMPYVQVQTMFREKMKATAPFPALNYFGALPW